MLSARRRYQSCSFSIDIDIVVVDKPDANGKAVPKLFAEAYSAQQKIDGVMRDGAAKLRLVG